MFPLHALLDVVQHIGGEFQEFFPLVLLAVYFDGGRVVSQAGHLEGTQGGGWEPAATETLLVQLHYAVPVL